MISEETKKWIEAVRAIRKDGTTQIPCPQCQTHYLNVHKKEIKGSGERPQLSLNCSKCEIEKSIPIHGPRISLYEEKSGEWIKAAKVVVHNRNTRMLCPKCELDYLEAFDINEKKTRMVICANCDVYYSHPL